VFDREAKMKKLINWVFLLFTSFVFSSPLLANNQVLVPLPSVDDFTKGNDGWAFGLGLGVEYETLYEGSDEFGLEAQPAGAIQWRSGDNIYFFAGEAFGWRGLRNEQWLFEALVGFDEGREESDSDEGWLDGLGAQEEGFELVLQSRYAFNSDWRSWLVGRIVTGGDGNLGLFGIGHRLGTRNDGSGHEFIFVAVFHDCDYANKGFGINETQATASGLAQTNISSGLRSIAVDYSTRFYINDHWQVFGEALFEYFSSEVRDSPIARSNYESEIGLGFIYIF
jgi:outer membrane scaffolding protein for murein synthesis (MipA/OmpV family)